MIKAMSLAVVKKLKTGARAGYSLVELIVVISIIVIITATVITTALNNQRNFSFDSEIAKIEQTLRKPRDLSISNETVTFTKKGQPVTKLPANYGITLDSSKSPAEMVIYKTIPSDPQQTTNIKTVQLDNRFQMTLSKDSTTVGAVDVKYETPFGFVLFDGNHSFVNVVISDPDTGRTKKFRIHRAAGIAELDN